MLDFILDGITPDWLKCTKNQGTHQGTSFEMNLTVFRRIKSPKCAEIGSPYFKNCRSSSTFFEILWIFKKLEKGVKPKMCDYPPFNWDYVYEDDYDMRVTN